MREREKERERERRERGHNIKKGSKTREERIVSDITTNLSLNMVSAWEGIDWLAIGGVEIVFLFGAAPRALRGLKVSLLGVLVVPTNLGVWGIAQ